MADEVATFRRRKQLERDRDEFDHLVEAAGARGAEEGLQLRKRELDRIEVRTVGRQEFEPGAPRFHGRAHLELLMRREIVEHDHIARRERRREHLFHVGKERRVIDRTVEDGRRREAIEAERGDHRVRLPVAAGCVIAEPRAARTSAVAPQQIRRDATLVEEQVVAHIPHRLHARPLPAGGGDVRPTLFVGVYGFF